MWRLVICWFTVALFLEATSASSQPPNLVMILADDLVSPAADIVKLGTNSQDRWLVMVINAQRKITFQTRDEVYHGRNSILPPLVRLGKCVGFLRGEKKRQKYTRTRKRTMQSPLTTNIYGRTNLLYRHGEIQCHGYFRCRPHSMSCIYRKMSLNNQRRRAPSVFGTCAITL